jgi:hypothetical protein
MRILGIFAADGTLSSMKIEYTVHIWQEGDQFVGLSALAGSVCEPKPF